MPATIKSYLLRFRWLFLIIFAIIMLGVSVVGAMLLFGATSKNNVEVVSRSSSGVRDQIRSRIADFKTRVDVINNDTSKRISEIRKSSSASKTELTEITGDENNERRRERLAEALRREMAKRK